PSLTICITVGFEEKGKCWHFFRKKSSKNSPCKQRIPHLSYLSLSPLGCRFIPLGYGFIPMGYGFIPMG
ncbi:MAG: hypothetical protein IK011_02590, partial [Bacteroidaceae bacterium]|nr:hypothetical protein [Bacteroidaceae bacterium]